MGILPVTCSDGLPGTAIVTLPAMMLSCPTMCGGSVAVGLGRTSTGVATAAAGGWLGAALADVLAAGGVAGGPPVAGTEPDPHPMSVEATRTVADAYSRRAPLIDGGR